MVIFFNLSGYFKTPITIFNNLIKKLASEIEKSLKKTGLSDPARINSVKIPSLKYPVYEKKPYKINEPHLIFNCIFK